MKKQISRYFVKIPKEMFYHLPKAKYYQIKADDNSIEFLTNRKGLQNVKTYIGDQAIVTDRYLMLLNKIVKKHLISMIALLIIIIILFTSSFFIREITFANEGTYNYQVYLDVSQSLKKRGPFVVLDQNINDLSQSLRENYPHYAYIGISKKGAKLIVEIIEQNTPSLPVDEEKDPGDLIAMHDALITGIKVEDGVVVTSINQMVKSGELLVSGNLLYQIDPNNRTNIIKAKGYIFGDFAKYEEIEVDKKSTYQGYTGRVETMYQMVIFNRPLFKQKTSFENYYIHYRDVFKISKNNRFVKVTFLEIADQIIEYNREEAQEYALSLIKRNFEMERVDPIEEIKYVKLIMEEETEDSYTFKYIVKYNKNIAKFIKY